MKDTFWMKKAIGLARKGEGLVSPNPLVGAVLVEKNRLIGEGYHAHYGGLHAERAAIEDAKRRTGRSSFPHATLYCTLEPCSYKAPHKKQPPCTEVILEAGIKKIVIAHKDPNPRVNGKGITALISAGCRIRQDVLKEEAAALNPGFITRMKTGHPLVTVKMAMSLDGRIATATGDSRWISSHQARTAVHRLRAENDAVLVGSGTVLADNPRLSVRHAEGPDPLRIVMDSSLRTPLDCHLASKGTLFFCGRTAPQERISALQTKGALVYMHPAEGHYPLEEMLKKLGHLGVNSLLVEGGSGIFTSFMRQLLYHKLEIFTAPLLLGEGINSLGDLGVTTIAEGHSLKNVRWQDAGEGNIRFRAWREAGICLPD